MTWSTETINRIHCQQQMDLLHLIYSQMVLVDQQKVMGYQLIGMQFAQANGKITWINGLRFDLEVPRFA